MHVTPSAVSRQNIDAATNGGFGTRHALIGFFEADAATIQRRIAATEL